MRHGKKINHLSRQAPHRKAMLANMACSLIEHKRVTTTVAKAKALKKYVEPLITKSKIDSTHSRRMVFSYLKNKEAVTELFRDISVKVGDRPGGYTRILKTGFRQGDNAEMCFIELVDYNENMLKDTSKKKSSRRKRGGGKKEETTNTVVEETTVDVTEADTKAEVVEETPVAEEVAVDEVVEDTPVEDAVAEEAPVEEAVAEEVVAEEAPVEEVVAEEVPEEVSAETETTEEATPEAEEDDSEEEEKKEE